MATNPFTTINTRAGDSDRSLNWYQQQIKTLAGVTPSRLMSSGETVSSVRPGNMYMFFYDPKHKDKLPFWDRFPLVLPFNEAPGGFLGINLHYMPYMARFKLLEKLHDLASNDKIEENRKVLLSWNILKGFASVAPIKTSVKHYLYEQVSSSFVKIKYTDWIVASQLPVEKFVGETKQNVWKNS